MENTQPNQPVEPMQQEQPVATGSDNYTATIVTILLLVFFFPVGVIVMWFWPKWKKWIKIVITTLFVVIILWLGIVSSVVLVALNPERRIEEARCATECKNIYAKDIKGCVERCVETGGVDANEPVRGLYE